MNPCPSGVPLNVLLVRPEVVGSTSRCTFSKALSHNSTQGAIFLAQKVIPDTPFLVYLWTFGSNLYPRALGPPIIDRIGASPGARGTPPRRRRARSSSVCTSTASLMCTCWTRLGVRAQLSSWECTVTTPCPKSTDRASVSKGHV